MELREGLAEVGRQEKEGLGGLCGWTSAGGLRRGGVGVVWCADWLIPLGNRGGGAASCSSIAKNSSCILKSVSINKVLLKHAICVPWLLCGTVAELSGWNRIVWPAQSVILTNLTLQERFRGSYSGAGVFEMGSTLPWNLLEKYLWNSVSETWGPGFAKPFSHVDLMNPEYRKCFYGVR